MPPTVIEPLSCVVRSKTGGVILFVLNFLKSLHEERLIYFNLTSLRWEFDLIKIIQKEVSGDIIDFLSERIMRLPRSVQAGLKIAACLGSTFDVAVFQKANKSADNVTEDFISMATENGFIHESSPNQFTWSHDQLQQAAYTLISTNMRQSTHLLVGARIFLNSRPEEVQSMIHDIVRNMNIGMSLLDSQERKTELAQLNLLAGEQSKKSSAFYSAANYFMTGIGLLDENWQNTSYDLAMKLYNSA
jgi:predicted ATPase